jgi:hypothetical protein
MPKNRLTILDIKEINGDLVNLHNTINKFYLSRYEVDNLEELKGYLAIYEDKYTALYEALIFSKEASYSYMSDKILTAILARIANYKQAIEHYLANGYSGHLLGELLRYGSISKFNFTKLYLPLTIELTANDINITIKEN